MIWSGTGARVVRGDDPAGSLVSLAIDFPDRGRPEPSDVGDHLAPYVGRAERMLPGARGGRVKVDVNIVWPSAERPWITAYTVGVSSRPMKVPPEVRSRFSPHAELLMRLPPAWVPELVCPLCVPRHAEREPLANPRSAWPFEWLMQLAHLPHDDDTFLGVGHVVEDSDPTTEGHGLPYSGFYFDPGFDAAGDRPIPPLVRPGGERVDFLGVVPLHPGEVRAFRERRGVEAALALDAAGVTDLLDPDRACCVR